MFECKVTKKYTIEGVFFNTIKTSNGRTYPKDVIEKAIDDYIPTVVKGMSFGMLGDIESVNINLDRVSHVIKGFSHNPDDSFTAWGEVLNTPMGLILQSLIDANVKIWLIPSGIGMINDGIVSDYKLHSINIINKPSSLREELKDEE